MEKIQEADLEWRLKYKFLSPSEYFESKLYIKIKEMFTSKGKMMIFVMGISSSLCLQVQQEET